MKEAVERDRSIGLDEIAASFAILKDELRDYVELEIGRARRGLRRFAVSAVLLGTGAFAAIAVAVTSIVFCLSGLAGWLAETTSRPWLGSLLAGLMGLGLSGGGLVVARAALRHRSGKEGKPT